MQRVMVLYKRIYMTALAAVLMFCLATTAKAGQFDYDAAMAKVTSEIYSKKNTSRHSIPSRKSEGTPPRATIFTANTCFTQPLQNCIMNKATTYRLR